MSDACWLGMIVVVRWFWNFVQCAKVYFTRAKRDHQWRRDYRSRRCTGCPWRKRRRVGLRTVESSNSLDWRSTAQAGRAKAATSAKCPSTKDLDDRTSRPLLRRLVSIGTSRHELPSSGQRGRDDLPESHALTRHRSRCLASLKPPRP